LGDIQNATDTVIKSLDENFFKVRFDRLTPSEKNFLRAIAEPGPSSKRTGDIALALNVKANTLSPIRSSLIKKGMIYSPAYGDIAFTVPLFDEFMIREIPELKI
jgi:DNA-binding MarR family transcriptional regulator